MAATHSLEYAAIAIVAVVTVIDYLDLTSGKAKSESRE